MNNTIPFHSATHAPQITVDVNILTMLKQAASCLTEAAGKDVYLAAIGPDMELTIIMEEDAPSVLPCFDEDDALISVKGAPLFISYNPAQVLKLAGKRYLTGPVIFYRTDGHSAIVSLTVEDGEPCAHPHGNMGQPRAEPHGAELPEMPVCTGFSGLSHPHLRGNLCGADTIGSDFWGCHQLHLEHCRLHCPALFQPVQDQLGDEIRPRSALKEVFDWLRIFPFPVT